MDREPQHSKQPTRSTWTSNQDAKYTGAPSTETRTSDGKYQSQGEERRGNDPSHRYIHESRSSANQFEGRNHQAVVSFRDISVFPSVEEVASNNYAHRPLPTPRLPTHLTSAFNINVDWLDYQFRLLREEFFNGIEDQVAACIGKLAVSKLQAESCIRSHIRKRTLKVRALGGLCWDPRHVTMLGIRVFFEQPPYLRKATDENSISRYRAYWEEKKKVLAKESLVLFVMAGDPIGFGIISYRVIDDLAKHVPSVGVTFLEKETRAQMVARLGCSYNEMSMIQLTSPVFAFAPVLKRLQEMGELPLLQEVSENSKAYFESLRVVTESLAQSNVGRNRKEVLNTAIHCVLDTSQESSLVYALENQVALIQGPPGTGKSFCGALLAKVIHDRTKEIMLLVCYTNHAVDQFLEDLLRCGVPEPSMCRLGFSPKIPDHVRPMMLQHRLESTVPRFGSMESKARAQNLLQQKILPLVSEIEAQNASWYSWDSIKDTLANHYPQVFETFYVSDTFADIQTLLKKAASPQGKCITSDEMWKAWVSANMRPPAAGALPDPLHLWSLDKAGRKKKLDIWRMEKVSESVSKLKSLLDEYERLSLEIKDSESVDVASNLRNGVRLVACTTTGAAKYASLLDKLNIGVVLVEEAGEILESHVITSLRESCKHLVMIGDHRQLRPKVNDYKLTVESGNGFDLNRSLFERLIGGMEHATLELQHRMRPEISSLVRHLVYPTLRDADSVLRYPSMQGSQSNVVFVNHQGPENEHNSLTQREEGSSSKFNMYEVGFVCAIVRFLLQQGYTAQNIVVLTPYLAQLNEIRKALPDSILGEKDAFDLFQVGEDIDMGRESGEGSERKIRISTVDNFQGEEGNIVILSLVRSNENGSIGFLCEIERVNVMLSRARHGLVVLGNLSTLVSSANPKGRKVWSQLYDLIESQHWIYDGFPVQCPRHKDSKFIISSPELFETKSPLGGCDEPCKTMLPCGHQCPLKCHPDELHRLNRCQAVESKRCAQGHVNQVRCGDQVDCQYSMQRMCDRSHISHFLCSKQPVFSECEQCDELDDVPGRPHVGKTNKLPADHRDTAEGSQVEEPISFPVVEVADDWEDLAD